ncbi:ABC transporter permease [Cryptosporangium phraense]|uniref:DUF3533 domain-containing protein n=1 Tax=Cryptosporangium phraense TaxID=2593070 RepID=A0A545AFY8_9ACTN|nr:ABC transporter permease [Cryptosporangium phraense]TQS40254.1 hypothetical protein FL583_35645 [Cryptosporangium phraense]
MSSETRITSARQFRRIASAVAGVGVLVQLLLTSYYLGMAHAPKPRELPVGLIANEGQAAGLEVQLNAEHSYDVTRYDTAADLIAATERREIYGGLDVTGTTPHLYVAGAAGPAAAAVLRTTFTTVLEKQTAAAVAQLPGTVPIATVRTLTAPGTITDVVPLPADDRNGGSLGMLVQALALGGTVASIGLGRLIPRARRSWRRGVGHLTTLVVYALASAAIVLWSASWFGVGRDADHSTLYWGFSLVSLAITGSTAGFVALIGPAGAAAGFLYFTIGTVISGASIPPEFLPAWGRHLGQALPTGAGTQYVRDSLYFPDAPLGHPLLILCLYAGLGALAILVTNFLPNRTDRTAELPLPGA